MSPSSVAYIQGSQSKASSSLSMGLHLSSDKTSHVKHLQPARKSKFVVATQELEAVIGEARASESISDESNCKEYQGELDRFFSAQVQIKLTSLADESSSVSAVMDNSSQEVSAQPRVVIPEDCIDVDSESEESLEEKMPKIN